MKTFFYLLFTVVALMVGGSTQSQAQTPEDQAIEPQTDKQIGQSLSEIQVAQGAAHATKNKTINGRVFNTAVFVGGKTVFPNADNSDLFEAWIGKQGGTEKGSVVFTVLGDGKQLYRSPKMQLDDPAIKIRVPIRGYSGITLFTEGERESKTWSEGVWADAVFVKLPAMVPVLVSPSQNEIIKQTSPLVWKPVVGVTGYLLELQATALADPNDTNDEHRFLAVQIPADITLYNFDMNKMPKGTWRWRIHALSPTGFLGQMEQWSVFTTR